MSDKKVRSLQRVVEVAAQAFASRKFNDVSISEISEKAHCSTSTIYSAFGSKENLFLDAMSLLLQTAAPGPATSNAPSMHILLGFAEARIRILANPARRGTIRAISSQVDLAQPLIDCLASQQCGSVTRLLRGEIVACVEGGMLRPLDPQLIAYTLMAVTAYEPIVYGLLYGDDKKVDAITLLEKVFTPLVTDKGARQLKAFIGQASGGAALPANEHQPAPVGEVPVRERRRAVR